VPHFAKPIERPHLVGGEASLADDGDMVDASVAVLVGRQVEGMRMSAQGFARGVLAGQRRRELAAGDVLELAGRSCKSSVGRE
jgi:hypothetical protein